MHKMIDGGITVFDDGSYLLLVKGDGSNTSVKGSGNFTGNFYYTDEELFFETEAGNISVTKTEKAKLLEFLRGDDEVLVDYL